MIRFSPWLCLLLMSVGTLRAEDKTDKYTQGVFNKMLKALGDSKEAREGASITAEVDATIEEGDQKIKMTGTWWLQGLGQQLRAEAQLQVQQAVQGLTLVINKDKGWALDQRTNKVDDAPEDALKSVHTIFRAIRLAQHPYLFDPKVHKLESLGELKIGNQQTLGLKIKEKGQKEVDLYIDKKTYLPIKCSVLVKEPMEANEVEYGFLLQDYKKLDNRKHFTKFILERDGTKVLEIKLTNIQLPKKLDAFLFKKPGS